MKWIVALLLAACGSSSSAPDAASVSDASHGTGSTCGGFANVQCDDTNFCDFANNGCGGDDSSGICMPKPSNCVAGAAACGCDRNVYPSDCAAESVGVDLADQGFCPPPQGTFACGHVFCDQSKYCRVTINDGGGANMYECVNYPASCNGSQTCDCLAGEMCGTNCAATTGGNTVTCP